MRRFSFFSLVESTLSRPWTCLFAAFACVVAESWTALDQAVQSVFFRDGGWLIGKGFHRAYDFTLYTVPKLAIGAVAMAALAVAVLARLARTARYRESLLPWRAPCLLLFLSICLISLAVGALKAATGVYGPVDLAPYGGDHAHTGVLDHLLTYGRPDTGRSFPAGHASGGFALIALFYLPLKPRSRAALAALGFALGWLMGLYQMARGEHFFTHTLTTMFLALGITGFLAGRLREIDARCGDLLHRIPMPRLTPSLVFRLRCLAAPAIVFCLAALVLRLVLPLAFPSDLPPSSAVLAGITLGFINDLAALSFALLVPATIFFALTDRFLRRFAGKAVCLAVLFAFSAIVIFSACAEYFFWDEFHARFNFIAVDYLIYTTELIRNAAESYPLGLILPGIGAASALVSLAAWRLMLRRTWAGLAANPEDGLSLSRRLLPLFCLYGLAACAFFLFTPLLPAQDRFWREYAKDGAYEIFSAFRHNQLDYRAFYRTMEAGSAFALMRGERAGEGNFVRPDDADLVRDVVAGGAAGAAGAGARPNVVLVIMESLGSKWLERSPNLRALASGGLSFSNMLSTGTRTVRGIEALMLSVPPTPGNSIVRRPDNADLFSLGTLFKERGYDLSFIYGGFGYFDNMNAFFAANGYRIVDKTSFDAKNKTFSTAWGQCDEDLFNQSLYEADRVHAAGKPFQQALLTTSNHRPFTYPEGKVDVKPGSSRTGAVMYSDYAVGRFMETARTRPWFDDTIFIFVGDHPSAVAGKTEVPADAYGIVCIMYGPRFFPPQKAEALCSQIDVAPTLFSRLNWSYRSQFFGRNALTAPPESGRAWISTYLLLGFRTLDGLAVLGPRGTADVAAITPEGKPAPMSAVQDKAWRQRLLDRTVASYQCAYDLFVGGKLTENYVRGR